MAGHCGGTSSRLPPLRETIHGKPCSPTTPATHSVSQPVWQRLTPAKTRVGDVDCRALPASARRPPARQRSLMRIAHRGACGAGQAVCALQFRRIVGKGRGDQRPIEQIPRRRRRRPRRQAAIGPAARQARLRMLDLPRVRLRSAAGTSASHERPSRATSQALPRRPLLRPD